MLKVPSQTCSDWFLKITLENPGSCSSQDVCSTSYTLRPWVLGLVWAMPVYLLTNWSLNPCATSGRTHPKKHSNKTKKANHFQKKHSKTWTLPTRTPKEMFFSWFYVTKNLQTTFVWGSWYSHSSSVLIETRLPSRCSDGQARHRQAANWRAAGADFVFLFGVLRVTGWVVGWLVGSIVEFFCCLSCIPRGWFRCVQRFVGTVMQFCSVDAVFII